MNKNFILLFLITFTMISCSSWKSNLVSKGNQNDAIQNAIIDFINTSSIYKNDSIFMVNKYLDNNNVLGLSIIENRGHKVYIYMEDTIGKYSKGLPTRYMMNNGKLFYWHDPEVKLSREIVDVLLKYNRIDSLMIDSADFYLMPPYDIDESVKATDYYFCKDNLRNYKKVVTGHAMGWYVPPKLKCNSCIKNKKSQIIDVSYTPGDYTVLDIREKKMYYVIFAQKNDSIFQIVSDKPFFVKPDGYKIKKGEQYDLKFTPLYIGRPIASRKKDYYYWKGSRLDLDAKTHFSIYHAENLDGLYLKE